MIALDFKKAFDSVPHDKLLEALYLAGIKGRVGEWIASWLEDCNFEVQIEEARSKPKNITHNYIPENLTISFLIAD